LAVDLRVVVSLTRDDAEATDWRRVWWELDFADHDCKRTTGRQKSRIREENVDFGLSGDDSSQIEGTDCTKAVVNATTSLGKIRHHTNLQTST
jgi:hypothetical protein